MSDADGIAGDVIDVLLDGPPSRDHRLRLGELLVAVFGADVFCSYVEDPSGPFSSPVAVNAQEDMLTVYQHHYRSVDWLTPMLRRRKRATAVTLANHQPDEFSQDFLRQRGMMFGMNYFGNTPIIGSIDIRLWRNADKEPFSIEDVRDLQRIGDLMQRLWPHYSTATIKLTPRELEVTKMLSTGLSDKEICHSLQMAASTLRTHIRHIFEKTACTGRTAVAHWYRSIYGG